MIAAAVNPTRDIIREVEGFFCKPAKSPIRPVMNITINASMYSARQK
jgi:hypothetical protein